MSDAKRRAATKLILCPADFSDGAAAAMEVAVALAKPFAAGIRVVHVRPAPPPACSPMSSRTRASADEATTAAEVGRKLERPRQAALASGLSIRTVVLRGDPSDQIVQEARHAAADLIVMGRHSAVRRATPVGEPPIQATVVSGVPHEQVLGVARRHDVDLIVVGSHGGGVVDRQFLGSTTLHLLREAESPVLVVPADVSGTESERDAGVDAAPAGADAGRAGGALPAAAAATRAGSDDGPAAKLAGPVHPRRGTGLGPRMR